MDLKWNKNPMTSQESSLKVNEILKNTLNDFLKFPLSEAIAGRRARRFCMGAEIPDGVLSFKSKYDPLSLSEIEQLLLLIITKSFQARDGLI